MKSILITGVAGFIGSNLARELLKRGYKVKGIDNFSQGFMRNIEEFKKNKSFSFFKGDIRNLSFFQKVGKGTDYLIHLAAYKIPRYGNALDTLMINTSGTQNALEVAKMNHCKLIFSSTSDIYGKNPSTPFAESSDIVLGQTNVARWSYAVSKIYDEHLIFAYQEEYGVPISIVRYFGGYGPNQNLTWWGGPQAVFITNALKKEPLPVHGNGKQTRSFTFISDLVEGTIAVMEKEEATGEAFNIGNTKETSILTLAKMIWKMINPEENPLIKFIPYQQFSTRYEDVSKRTPDITKAKKILDFEPKIEIEEGLTITINWQKEIKT